MCSAFHWHNTGWALPVEAPRDRIAFPARFGQHEARDQPAAAHEGLTSPAKSGLIGERRGGRVGRRRQTVNLIPWGKHAGSNPALSTFTGAKRFRRGADEHVRHAGDVWDLVKTWAKHRREHRRRTPRSRRLNSGKRHSHQVRLYAVRVKTSWAGLRVLTERRAAKKKFRYSARDPVHWRPGRV